MKFNDYKSSEKNENGTKQYLVDFIFPSSGLVALVSNDTVIPERNRTGSHEFCGELIERIAPMYLGIYGLNHHAQHGRVIAVLAEPVNDILEIELADYYERQGGIVKITTAATPDLISPIQKLLDRPADVIIIWLNEKFQPSHVSKFLEQFKVLTEKHRCPIVFSYSCNIDFEKLAPGKTDLFESEVFKDYMQMVMELRNDKNNSNLWHLCVLKSAVDIEEFKRVSLVFYYSISKGFKFTWADTPLENLVEGDTTTADNFLLYRIEDHHKAGSSIEDITADLIDLGYAIDSSKVKELVELHCSSKNPEEEAKTE